MMGESFNCQFRMVVKENGGQKFEIWRDMVGSISRKIGNQELEQSTNLIGIIAVDKGKCCS